MAIDDSLIGEIVRGLLGVSRPDRIILFGSTVTGQMTLDSDIDLLVVARDASNIIEDRLKLLDALRGLDFPLTFSLLTRNGSRRPRTSLAVAYPAHKCGRVIYEPARREVVNGLQKPI